MDDVRGCLACDLAAGREPLPGGLIWETNFWRVENCVGPLGVGTLLVKPKRHITRVADLTAEEAEELGPVLWRTALVIERLVESEQTYVCLWSHAGGEPVHIHYVVQPVSRALMEEHDSYGPRLQVEMFTGGNPPAEDAMVAFADVARSAFADL
jgi:diadenosine tetraphosphate (Ap4A) HIT family hydrolase